MQRQLNETLDVTSAVGHDGVAVVVLTGEIDMTNAGAPLAKSLGVLELAPAGLVVDLRSVGFFGSSGINLLVTVEEQARRRGVPFGVVASHPAVLKPLTMTGVRMQFPLFPSVADALAGLRAVPAQRRAS
ncbi:STAS domain-containing protein [Lentzea cavernae]|uniref:STAS domain-containing protein n=1 Tax=Lentzea cavernae TaxID=2020703 RepID=A0ABQ3MCN8_9PSEU|nr:STAS domain-containing protein [Lentzea cavernae]GHH38649.1 hypothetical protein GCM10017774_28900 [Lentzea cavernae]